METNEQEYCGSNGYIKYAGVHLIVDLWQARHLADIQKIEEIIRRAIKDCGATLLSLELHEFSPNGGVSGVGILQESHISIHTWPEYEYAAMDIFVCGTVDPYKTLPAIKEGFQPGKVQINEQKRGIME
ncbi:MAG: adenosylmethionine decarboxylase [Phycisphaerae bacterium]|nr:adenosylmethionine decarboxylase [Phycisphaerae bacterium]